MQGLEIAVYAELDGIAMICDRGFESILHSDLVIFLQQAEQRERQQSAQGNDRPGCVHGVVFRPVFAAPDTQPIRQRQRYQGAEQQEALVGSVPRSRPHLCHQLMFVGPQCLPHGEGEGHAGNDDGHRQPAGRLLSRSLFAVGRQAQGDKCTSQHDKARCSVYGHAGQMAPTVSAFDTDEIAAKGSDAETDNDGPEGGDPGQAACTEPR